MFLESGRIVAAFGGDDFGLVGGPLEIDVGQQVNTVQVDIARDAPSAAYRHGLRVYLSCQLVFFANLVAPHRYARATKCCEAESLDTGWLHLLFCQHTIVGNAVNGYVDIGGAIDEFPLSLGLTCDGSVIKEFNLNRQHFFHFLVVQPVFVHQQLPLARHLTALKELCRGILLVSLLFSVVFEGGSHEPSILVQKQLMYAHEMPIGSIVELCVVDQIGPTILGCNYRVMALCTLAYGLEAPLVVAAHEQLTSVRCVRSEIHLPRGKSRWLVSAVHVRSVWIF